MLVVQSRRPRKTSSSKLAAFLRTLITTGTKIPTASTTSTMKTRTTMVHIPTSAATTAMTKKILMAKTVVAPAAASSRLCWFCWCSY